MPLEVTLLPANTFQEYLLIQQASGADLANFKVPHVNPPENMLDFLTSRTRKVAVASRKERQPASIYSR